MTNLISPTLPDIQAYGSWVSPGRVRAAYNDGGLEVAKKVSAGEDGDCHPIWRTIKENFANKNLSVAATTKQNNHRKEFNVSSRFLMLIPQNTKDTF